MLSIGHTFAVLFPSFDFLPTCYINRLKWHHLAQIKLQILSPRILQMSTLSALVVRERGAVISHWDVPHWHVHLRIISTVRVLIRQFRFVCDMGTELYCFCAVSTLLEMPLHFWPPCGQTLTRARAIAFGDCTHHSHDRNYYYHHFCCLANYLFRRMFEPDESLKYNNAITVLPSFKEVIIK